MSTWLWLKQEGWTDKYTLYARAMPVFVVLLPIGMAVSVWYSRTALLPASITSFGVPV